MTFAATIINRLVVKQCSWKTSSIISRTGSRFLSSSSGYSSKYEYPLATEPPEITRTNAADARQKSNNNNKLSYKKKAYDLVKDPFDDLQSLSDAEREQIRQAQKQYLNTKPAGTLPITEHVPSFVPPNVPSDELATPETCLTTLDNGVRIVSQELYGQVSTVGVVCELGSRTERQPTQRGVTNLLEVIAFGTTKQYSGATISGLLQDWGGTRFVSTGREQSLHCIDLLRPNVDKAVHLLQQVVLEPVFLEEEVQDAQLTLQYQALDMPPDLLLGEALQMAAYGSDQQLGQPHFCPADALPGLNRELCLDYWQTQVLQNPKGIVVGGAGVQHDYLVELVEKEFGHLKQQPGRNPVIPSVYRGGEHRWQLPPLDATSIMMGDDENSGSSGGAVVMPSMPQSATLEEQNLTRIALAFEVGGWHDSEDLVTTCVLQTLLGGGSSFSAGGPGKGMYSRLYRQVLNRYAWAESAEAFTAFHNESGLWGISGSTQPEKARDMVQVLAEHAARLAVEPVSDEELDRARNMLKNNVLTQLESRLVLFEDLARQVLTYGQREDMHTTCEKIEAVTAEDIQALAIKALQQPPALACVGVDLSQVPRQSEVAEWFN